MLRFMLALPLLLLPGGVMAQTVADNVFVIQSENATARTKLQQAAATTLANVRKTWGVTGPVSQGRIQISYKNTTAPAAGSSTYVLDANNPPADVRMQLQGDLKSILKNELPRQLTHIVLANQYGAGPRWVEMGTGLLAGSKKQQRKNWQKLRAYRDAGALLPMGQLLAFMHYPSSSEDIKTMYVQSLALTEFVIKTNGRQALLAVAADGRDVQIGQAVKKHLGYESIGDFDVAFRQWLTDRLAD